MPRLVRARVRAVLLLVALVAVPVAAHAQARPVPAPEPVPVPDAPDAADALLDEGTRLFTQEADYDGALSRFGESYRQRPSWKALSGMALVYQQQGRYIDAIEAYERLLGEFGDTLTEAQMGTVRRRLGELQKRVAVVVVRIAQPDAVVFIDGHEVSRGASEVRVRVLPGPHTLVATLARHDTLTRRLDARAGATETVDVRLPAERVKVVLHRPRLERPYPTWVPWLTLGGGVLAAAAGGGLHVAAARDFEAFDAAVLHAAEIGKPAADVDDSLERSGRAKQVAAVSLYAVGGAALATGVILFIVNQPRPPEPGHVRVGVYYDGSSFGVAGSF